TLLDEAQTTQTVINLEKTAKGSNPQLFFERIKSDAFIFYYANPASWYGLGLSSPPQPVGYPNHDQPPVPNH
uniref:hypothetical protein n=1 Tax=Methylophaga sp. TaxID=2024840 RepID=UPI003F695613